MTRTDCPSVVAVVVLLLTGCNAGPPVPREAPSTPADLKLTIRAGKAVYDLEEASAGNVTVLARFENTGSKTILLAHPNVGFPRELTNGETLVREDERGAITVMIEHPQGPEALLKNNNLRRFDPGGRDHLLILPGNAEEILLGWFGPYFSLGQWAAVEDPIFTASGEYRMTVRYWNDWPIAYITDNTGAHSAVNPWIGEVESNTITLRVE